MTVLRAIGRLGFGAGGALGLQRLLALFAQALLIVDVSAGSVPTDDRARRIAHGGGAAEEPAVLAVVPAEAVLDLVRFAARKRLLPAHPRSFAVVGVKRVGPLLALGLLEVQADVFVPASVV